MKACAFFGHRDENYGADRELIKNSIANLIENYGVGIFYSGGRGNFDRICSEIVFELKKEYPFLQNFLVFSYLPNPKSEFMLPSRYDESVYLIERSVPSRYAILETNKAIVKRVDFVLSGVRWDWGGAWKACEYARKKGKTVLNLYA